MLASSDVGAIYAQPDRVGSNPNGPEPAVGAHQSVSGGRLQAGIGTRQFKIIVEKYADGSVAYPLGMKRTVVGEGDTYEQARAGVRSATRFHLEGITR